MEYKTKQKEAVMQCIIAAEGEHITADEIIRRLSFQRTPVGKATVYRCLQTLCADGVIRKYVAEGEPACYQYACEHRRCEKLHLKCDGCGELLHADSASMYEAAKKLMSAHGFAVDESKTVIYGKCRKCRGKMV